MELQGNSGLTTQSLVDRVKNILLKPTETWEEIGKEPATLGGLYKNYIFILAAIAPIANLIHGLAFGYSMLGITYRPSISTAIITAVTSYLWGLAMVWVLGMVIDALAPSFGATKDRIQAFKVATYASTAAWVAGIFNLLPGIGFLVLLGLYSFYLLYLGLPRLMKAPDDKTLGYTAVSAIAAGVLTLLAGMVTTSVVSTLAPNSAIPTDGGGTLSGELSIPGVGKVDVGKIEQLSKELESGKSKPVAASALEALLPGTLDGLARSKISSGSAGVGGIGGSNAEARYEGDGKSITLSVTDISAAGALAGLGGLLNLESNEKTADGYERTGKVDGHMTNEKWNESSKSGTYGTVVADRFFVQANGSGTSMEALKSAVAGVDESKLEDLVE